MNERDMALWAEFVQAQLDLHTYLRTHPTDPELRELLARVFVAIARIEGVK